MVATPSELATRFHACECKELVFETVSFAGSLRKEAGTDVIAKLPCQACGSAFDCVTSVPFEPTRARPLLVATSQTAQGAWPCRTPECQ